MPKRERPLQAWDRAKAVAKRLAPLEIPNDPDHFIEWLALAYSRGRTAGIARGKKLLLMRQERERKLTRRVFTCTGNNGGDVLEFTELGRNMVRLKMAQACAWHQPISLNVSVLIGIIQGAIDGTVQKRCTYCYGRGAELNGFFTMVCSHCQGTGFLELFPKERR